MARADSTQSTQPQEEAQFLRRVVLWVVLGVVVFVAVIGLHDWRRPEAPVMRTLIGVDFPAFYCGGEVARHRADPYRLEPLRSCEQRVSPEDATAQCVLPAPYPGPTLALFEVLSLMPYASAKLVWASMLVAALLVTAVTLAELTGFPAFVVLLALAGFEGYASLHVGQVPPIFMALLSLAGYFVARGRHEISAAICSFSMIEPHLGVPACVGMFVWLPRSRAVLALAAAAYAAVSIAAIGLKLNVEYVRFALPAQAAAEVPNMGQWSLTHVLYLFGVDEKSALRYGALDYVIMCTFGIIVGRRLATVLDADEFVLFMPVAAAMLGGSFLHAVQMAAALPAAFVLAARAIRYRPVAWLALLLLVIPPPASWGAHLAGPVTWGWLYFVGVLSLAFVGLRGARTYVRLSGAFAAALASVVLVAAIRAHPVAAAPAPQDCHLPPAVLQPDALASANWEAATRYTNAQVHWSQTRIMLEKLPTWTGLILLLATAVAQGTAPRRRAP